MAPQLGRFFETPIHWNYLSEDPDVEELLFVTQKIRVQDIYIYIDGWTKQSEKFVELLWDEFWEGFAWHYQVDFHGEKDGIGEMGPRDCLIDIANRDDHGSAAAKQRWFVWYFWRIWSTIWKAHGAVFMTWYMDVVLRKERDETFWAYWERRYETAPDFLVPFLPWQLSNSRGNVS